MMHHRFAYVYKTRAILQYSRQIITDKNYKRAFCIEIESIGESWLEESRTTLETTNEERVDSHAPRRGRPAKYRRRAKHEAMDHPDETDNNIIAALRPNPRITNREIAIQLDIAESTVALRIRGMADRGVMRVIAQKHVFSDDYNVMCFLFINTSRRTVQKVSADIAKCRDVSSVAQILGNPDIFVAMRATSLQSAHELANRIGDTSGVDTVELCAGIHVHKYVSALGDFTTTHNVEEAEDSIFVPLSQDGRQSNREVARQLGISETTVRQRLNKMLQQGDMQFQVVCNPAALRPITTACARITTLSRYTDEVLEELQHMESISFLAEVTGEANILAFLNASNTQELGDLCDNQVLSLPGVRSMQVQLLVSSTKHLVHYAYFDALEEIPRRK